MITAAASLFLALGFQEVAPTVAFKVESFKKDVVKGTVTVSIPQGWHAYQNPPKDEYENPLTLTAKTKGFKLAKITYPKGEPMTSFGTDTLVYQGDVKIPFEGKIEKALQPKKGVYSVDFDISYQICNESTCKPPSSVKATLNIKVGK
ncbi:MAG: hypothetical protein JST51_03880 [Armatimonadetes bacterium]|nr:hypothetical protein [Armatimonadota bacterium]